MHMIAFRTFRGRLSPSEVQPKPPRLFKQLTKFLALHNLSLLCLAFFLSLLMACIDKPSSRVILTDITNVASAAQPFNTIIDYLLPGRSSIPSPSEPLPNFERPATPLGVRTLDMEDSEPGQDLTSACSRIVSESWEGLSEALQCAKESLRSSPSGSPIPQVVTSPALPSMIQDRLKTARRKPTRKPPQQPFPTPAQTPVRFRYHGHSNSALADYKYFWNSRCEDWMRYEASLEEVSLAAYDGIKKVDPNKDRKYAPASRCPRFRRNGKTERESEADETKPTVTGYRGKYVPDLTAPIYPRTGDLALLHHPGVLETELLFVSFPLYKIHQIFFAFSLDQRSDRHRRQVEASDRGSAQSTVIEDWSPVGGGAIEDFSFWSEDTLVEDEELLPHPGDRKLDGRYQEACSWEVDWATKWEVLMNSFKQHELEHQAKIYSEESSEAKRFQTLEPYRAALADDTVAVGFLDRNENQFTRTGSESDLFDEFEDIVVC